MRVWTAVLLWTTCAGLVRAQAEPPPDREVATLVVELERSYDSRSWDAVHRLALIGAPAVPALVDVLRGGSLGSSDDARKSARYQAALALRRMGAAGREAVPTLLAIVKDPSDDEGVRWASAAALGSIGERPDAIVPALVDLLAGPPSSLSFYATVALGDLSKKGGAARQAVASALPALSFASWRYGDVGGFGAAFAAIEDAVEEPSPGRLAAEDEIRAAGLRDRMLTERGRWCLMDTVPDTVLLHLADLGVTRERDGCPSSAARLEALGEMAGTRPRHLDVGRVVWRSNDRASVCTGACEGAIPCSATVHVVERGAGGWWLGGWWVVKREYPPAI